MHKPIYDITPVSLLDFPQKIACIIWFAGCNMRCPYCYNVNIVEGRGTKTVDEISHFLQKRAGKLDGVVFSGGECTLHPEALKELALLAKEHNYAVKVDTNGSNSDLIAELIQEDLIDYIALDFKGPKYQMAEISQLKTVFSRFEKTFDLLQKSAVDFEVRTTVHSALHSKNSLLEMGNYLQKKNYKNSWYWQEFVNAPNTVGNIGASKKGYANELHSLMKAHEAGYSKIELRN